MKTFKLLIAAFALLGSTVAYAKPNGCTSGGKGITCCWVQVPGQPAGYLQLVCRKGL